MLDLQRLKPSDLESRWTRGSALATTRCLPTRRAIVGRADDRVTNAARGGLSASADGAPPFSSPPSPDEKVLGFEGGFGDSERLDEYGYRMYI